MDRTGIFHWDDDFAAYFCQSGCTAFPDFNVTFGIMITYVIVLRFVRDTSGFGRSPTPYSVFGEADGIFADTFRVFILDREDDIAVFIRHTRFTIFFQDDKYVFVLVGIPKIISGVDFDPVVFKRDNQVSVFLQHTVTTVFYHDKHIGGMLVHLVYPMVAVQMVPILLSLFLDFHQW